MTAALEVSVLYRMNVEHRIETDSMGEMQVPLTAYYGAQTARAIENFPVSNLRFPRRFLRALGLIKKHAAATNAALGLLPANIAAAVQQAAQEVIEGNWDAQFPVDIFQTGSGTSTNMNANEVIGRLSNSHPNDEVNRGQSSNDVIPAALHISAAEMIRDQLRPAMRGLQEALESKAREFDDVIKIGRTHLQDAVPIRLGQEFSGYARQVEAAMERVETALTGMYGHRGTGRPHRPAVSRSL
jgi:fumarate hydratase, class II